jgi:hypothetical protein
MPKRNESQKVIDWLKLEALRFRQAIETSPEVRCDIAFKAFPEGSCLDASLLLAKYLGSKGESGFFLVSAERGTQEKNDWKSHAWLRRGKIIIDITADQFKDAPEPVIVSNASAFHSRFRVNRQSEASIDSYDRHTKERLFALYRAAIGKLSNV